MSNRHWGWVSIVARRPTWLKKQPVHIDYLPSNDRADVSSAISIRRCRVLDHSNDHTYLETGLGDWWVEDAHWDGLTDEEPTVPYLIDRDLIYLKDFPYFQQDPEKLSDSQAFTLAMCLKYLNTPTINSVNDYLEVVNKYGRSRYRTVNSQALIELGMGATFTHSADPQDIMDQIHKGLPVAASLLSKGDVTAPTKGTHLVAITGYGADYWLVQDPFGEMDLINGRWSDRTPDSGKNIKYDFESMNKRLFVSGGASGWCWVNFRKR